MYDCEAVLRFPGSLLVIRYLDRRDKITKGDGDFVGT